MQQEWTVGAKKLALIIRTPGKCQNTLYTDYGNQNI